MLTAPTRSPVNELVVFSHPGARVGGLWRRPPTAVTVGPACRIRPLLVEPAEVSPGPNPTQVAEEFAWSTLRGADLAWDRSGDVPWADRRLADRLPVRPGSRVEIRRWGDPSGPELAEDLLNVSDVGVGVRLCTPLRRGARLTVTLWGPGAAWCGRGMGLVRWAVVGEGRTCVAGLRLSRRLTAQALQDLVERPRLRRDPPADDFELTAPLGRATPQ